MRPVCLGHNVLQDVARISWIHLCHPNIGLSSVIPAERKHMYFYHKQSTQSRVLYQHRLKPIGDMLSY